MFCINLFFLTEIGVHLDTASETDEDEDDDDDSGPKSIESKTILFSGSRSSFISIPCMNCEHHNKFFKQNQRKNQIKTKKKETTTFPKEDTKIIKDMFVP